MRELGLDASGAARLRRDYHRDHGTTLGGLIAVHGIDPDPFLDEVHRVDLSALRPDPRLRAAIAALPGRKVVYTNGSRAHAAGVTAALGLSGCFAAQYGMEDAGYRVKPTRPAFDAVFGADGLDPRHSAMIEDDQRNLAEPAAMGLATIWRPVDAAEPRQDHVDHVADDLAGFLTGAVAA